jgi:hypothetical protein
MSSKSEVVKSLTTLSSFPSFQTIAGMFQKMKSDMGLYYPSKRNVIEALKNALHKCSASDLHRLATQLEIENKDIPETKLRLEILDHVFYKLYNAPIRAWNVSVTSGALVVLLLLIQKLISFIGVEKAYIMKDLNALLSISYITIGTFALSTIFFRWLRSKNLRNKVLILLNDMKKTTTAKTYPMMLNKPNLPKRHPSVDKSSIAKRHPSVDKSSIAKSHPSVDKSSIAKSHPSVDKSSIAKRHYSVNKVNSSSLAKRHLSVHRPSVAKRHLSVHKPNLAKRHLSVNKPKSK